MLSILLESRPSIQFRNQTEFVCLSFLLVRLIGKSRANVIMFTFDIYHESWNINDTTYPSGLFLSAILRYITHREYDVQGGWLTGQSIKKLIELFPSFD